MSKPTQQAPAGARPKQLHPLVLEAKDKAKHLHAILSDGIAPDCKLTQCQDVVARLLYQAKDWGSFAARMKGITPEAMTTEQATTQFLQHHFLPMLESLAAERGLRVLYPRTADGPTFGHESDVYSESAYTTLPVTIKPVGHDDCNCRLDLMMSERWLNLSRRGGYAKITLQFDNSQYEVAARLASLASSESCDRPQVIDPYDDDEKGPIRLTLVCPETRNESIEMPLSYYASGKMCALGAPHHLKSFFADLSDAFAQYRQYRATGNAEDADAIIEKLYQARKVRSPHTELPASKMAANQFTASLSVIGPFLSVRRNDAKYASFRMGAATVIYLENDRRGALDQAQSGYFLGTSGTGHHDRVVLKNFSRNDVLALSKKFGIPFEGAEDPVEAFYRSEAFAAFKQWAKQNLSEFAEMKKRGMAAWLPDLFQKLEGE